MRLRADANVEGDQMAKCFAESHEAYERGDGAGAKQLSNEGKEHQVSAFRISQKIINMALAPSAEDDRSQQGGERLDFHR